MSTEHVRTGTMTDLDCIFRYICTDFGVDRIRGRVRIGVFAYWTVRIGGASQANGGQGDRGGVVTEEI